MSLSIEIPSNPECNRPCKKAKTKVTFNTISTDNIYNENLFNRLNIAGIKKPNKSILSDKCNPILQSSNSGNFIIDNTSNNSGNNPEPGGVSNVHLLYNSRILKIIRNQQHNLTEVKAILFNFYLQRIPNGNVKYICKIYEYGFTEDSGQLYCIMQNGGDDLIKLQELLNFQVINKNNLLLLLNIFLECAKAVKFIHDCGYIHLDIKPDNFLIKFNKTTQKFEIKIIDFGGFAKIGSKIISRKGTPGFINMLVNKNFNKNITYTVTYDIFSLGQTFEILYSNIIGKIKFINNNIIRESIGHIEYKIYKLFYKMISPHRPGFNNVLDNYLQEECSLLIQRYMQLSKIQRDMQLSKIQKDKSPLSLTRYSSIDKVIEELTDIILDISSL